MIAPAHLEIGWGMIVVAGAGSLALAYHHLYERRGWWPAANEGRQVATLKGGLAAHDGRVVPEIVFDPADPRCLPAPYRRAVAGRPKDSTNIIWYHLRLRNPSDIASMDEVSVLLDPTEYTKELHRAMVYDRPFPVLYGPATLHPRSTEYVQLVGLFDGEERGALYPQTITVRVRARNLPEAAATFTIDPSLTPAIRQHLSEPPSKVG